MIRAKPADSEEAVAAGRRDYASKRYKSALEQFTRAMKLCPCARGTKRERCSCKNFEQTAAQDGSIFNEAMYKCSCSVGKTFNKCDNEHHIKALDYRAATFEALKELERAKRDAEWILELAPRQPDGYLRLGKIARLSGKDEFAWKVYNAGIDAGNVNQMASTNKLQQLYKARATLHIRFCRRDPIQLPAEIMYWILSYCNLATRVRCLRVSKTWKSTFSSRGYYSLWRTLDFTGASSPSRPVRIEALRKLTSLAGQDVREIIIDENSSKFFLSQPKFLALLSGSKNLEHLQITHPKKELQMPDKIGLTKTLQTLTLRYINPDTKYTESRPDPVLDFPYSFTDNVAGSIQTLYLAGLPSKWLQDEKVPDMPNLKYLRLGRYPNTRSFLNLMHIAAKTPALEQLWLQNTPVALSYGWEENWDKLWPKLNSLSYLFPEDSVLDRDVECAISVFVSMHRGENMKHVDFAFKWTFGDSAHPKDLLPDKPVEGLPPQLLPHSSTNDLLRPNNYKNLQTLRLPGISLNPATTGRLLEQQAANGKLTDMDIVFPLEPLQATLGVLSASHLAGYEWLRGCTSIRSMGIFQFRFRSYPRNDEDLPLPDFLASFPNLEVLEIRSENYEEAEFCTVLGAIVKVTKLKVIYQNQVFGALMDKLLLLGSSWGVDIRYGERPRQWPVPV